ncbi:MAG: cytochrome-c peroxidase [Croceitalea sp.]|nr:cytochrome-c peroxidase [Croceitalea sp.]
MPKLKSILSRACQLITFLFLISGCTDDDLYNEKSNESELETELIQLLGSLEAWQLPNSSDYLNIPNDPNNPITHEKVVLGKFLFHETALGNNPTSQIGLKTYSCASCHHAKAGFQSGIKQGIGEGGLGFGLRGETRIMSLEYNESELDVQPIRSPTVINTAYQEVMLWNGQFGATGKNLGTEGSWTPGTPKENNLLGFQGVETQAIAGLGVHRMSLDSSLLENESYKSLFDQAFPNDQAEERYSIINAGLAIAAYERTILANESPFQKWLRGEEKLSENEMQGAIVFFGKGKCYTCHSGPGLNGMEFHALGMNDLQGDDVHGTLDETTKKGRGGFTDNPQDDYKFKTPTLYNLNDVNHLGHGGNFNNVKEVIEYKNQAIPQNAEVPLSNISPSFRPLGLSLDEINMLSTFIENALYDDQLERYVPISTPMQSCFPNADSQSKEDMGCD